MQVAIALRTRNIEIGVKLESGSEPTLIFLILALLLALVGTVLDIILAAGGWIGLYPATMALGMALMLFWLEVGSDER